ncbi:MAG: serine/threonine-protein kinase [Acidobacteriota bacterium]
MAADTWQQIREVLDEALEMPAERRGAFVDGACADEALRRQVHSILAAYDDETAFLDRGRPEIGSAPAAAEAWTAGRMVGPWRLSDRLGAGGMGTVFLARRADDAYAKDVAIKLLKRSWAGEEEIRRFRRERQILADLEHPNIAQLLDGGNTDEGQPYLVMEYVEGVPIDTYCRQHELGLDARLRLFLDVCSAVQFAHQNLIVHRDIKPSNIMVDRDGRAKLLDFGIAKILAPDHFAETVLPTRTGLTPMTPEYASPEQVRGQPITTASDVYSLGVLLYSLLTGISPYHFDGRDLTAVVDAVCNQDVVAPSSRIRRADPDAVTDRHTPSGEPERLARVLRGDLDAIVLRALAKEPERRYATAEQLADDLRRYFARQPVRARRHTTFYRTGKFLRRHRVGIAATATVFLILLAAILALLAQQDRLRQERNRAVFERQRAETVSRWLIELFGLPDPGRSLGEKITARELLDKSGASILRDLTAEPTLSAELLGTLGETYSKLGLLPEARRHLEAARDLYRSTIVSRRPTVDDLDPDGSAAAREGRLADVLFRLADVLQDQGHYLEARRVMLEARARAADGSPLAVRSQAVLGHLDGLLGDTASARARFASARDSAHRLDDAELQAFVFEHAAEFHEDLGDTTRAREDYSQALRLRRSIHGDRHPKVALLESSLASFTIWQQADEASDESAEARLRASIERQRELYDEGHPALATSLNNLALLLSSQRRFEEAEALYDESLAMKRAIYGDSHPKIAATLSNLGLLAAEQGELEVAETRSREALTIHGRELGEQHPGYAFLLGNLGELALMKRDVDQAADTLEQARTIIEATLGAEHSRLVLIFNNLGEVARLLEQPAAARRHFSRAVEIARAQETPHPDLPTVLYNLALVELKLDALDEALAHLEAVVERAGEDAPLGRYASTYLAHKLVDAGHPEAARTWARRALDAWERAEVPDEIWVQSARNALNRADAAVGAVATPSEEAEAQDMLDP